MAKGRKAEPGTYEVREFVKTDAFTAMIDSVELSAEGKARLKKAILFGVGVKA